jgi:6-phosphogluconolactonase (cycloisomerase 2 family)
LLYVANDCGAWQNRPCATVEALALAPDGAPARSLARVPLALSALAPRSLAVSADGRYLLVSAFEGGAWNSFSLDKDGIPAPNPAALKEVGCGAWLPGQAAAHPHTILPVDSGAGVGSLFVGSDYGTDRLSLLEAHAEAVPGYEAGALAARYRHQLPAASGAMHLALHSQSGLVVASSLLRPALHSLHITEESGPALAPLQSVPLGFAPSALAFHPQAGILYVIHSAGRRVVLTLWQAAGGSGMLHRLEEHELPAGAAASLAVQANQLWIAGPAGILGLALDLETGRLAGSRMQLLGVAGVGAMLVHQTPA